MEIDFRGKKHEAYVVKFDYAVPNRVEITLDGKLYVVTNRVGLPDKGVTKEELKDFALGILFKLNPTKATVVEFEESPIPFLGVPTTNPQTGNQENPFNFTATTLALAVPLTEGRVVGTEIALPLVTEDGTVPEVKVIQSKSHPYKGPKIVQTGKKEVK